MVMFLLSYLPVFPSFLRLRKADPDRERPFKVPGGNVMQKIMAIVPMILIVVSVIFTAVPLAFDAETLSTTLPITVGSVIFLALGEIIIALCRRKSAVK